MTTGAALTFSHPRKPKTRVTVGALSEIAPAANAYLSFTGVGFSTGKQRSFQAIAGATAPTVTGGYAKWKTVPRPLARSLTIFDGYDPVQMTVEIIFGSWANGWQIDDSESSHPTEDNIAVLEWMAGSNFQVGPSPVVYMWSYSAKGGAQSDLIPPQYQSVGKNQYPWIVTGLQWGTAVRNSAGFRVWQEATVTLENYLNIGAPPKATTSANGGYFVSRAGRNQPILIAAAATVKSPMEDHQILAGRICQDPHNNPCKGHPNLRLNGKGLRFQIPDKVPVFVPGHQII
jgi:hypothetical protein